jgi:hypothetical protein
VKAPLSLRRAFPLIGPICLAALALPWVAEPIHWFFFIFIVFSAAGVFLIYFWFLGKIF